MRVMGREIMEESSSTSRMENAVMMTVMMTSWARSVSTVVLMGVMVASTMNHDRLGAFVLSARGQNAVQQLLGGGGLGGCFALHGGGKLQELIVFQHGAARFPAPAGTAAPPDR